jgi:hypothetical protein
MAKELSGDPKINHHHLKSAKKIRSYKVRVDKLLFHSAISA